MHVRHMQTVKSQMFIRPPTAPLKSKDLPPEIPHKNKYDKSIFFALPNTIFS